MATWEQMMDLITVNEVLKEKYLEGNLLYFDILEKAEKMKILEQLKKLSEEMNTYKKRIVVNPDTYNRYKSEFDELVKTHHVLIFSDDLVPEDRILIMDSEAEEMERIMKPFKKDLQ